MEGTFQPSNESKLTDPPLKYLYMLVGLPLSGKTTFRKQMFKNFSGIIVSSDDIIEQYAERLGFTYNEAFARHGLIANKEAFELGKYAADKTVNVVWDQTNLTKKSRATKLELFPKHLYYKIAYVLPMLGNEELELRQKNPNRKGKTIPTSVLSQMRKSFEYPNTSEGFNEVHTVVSALEFFWTCKIEQEKNMGKSILEKERERLLDFFSARYYDCENDLQKFNVRQQLLTALSKLESGHVTEQLIKEVDEFLPK